MKDKFQQNTTEMKPIRISYLDEEKGHPMAYEVGRNCVSIKEHLAFGEGDKWYYDIELVNDKILRIFVSDSTTILYEK
jgi:hypothetical protein